MVRQDAFTVAFSLVLTFDVFAVTGATTCPCLATPTNPKQTSATGKPAYVGTVPAYGWGCKTHDKGQHNCSTTAPANLVAGQSMDWCEDQWCIVSKSNCHFKTREVSFTAAADDYFSYETCDTQFTGNGWVGRCKNCGSTYTTNSYCTCGGATGCKCKTGTPKQTPATGKPAYVGTVAAYGWGCKAHDKGQHNCSTTAPANRVAGQSMDWCEDQWCVVNKNSCNTKTREVSFTAALDDYFSYETCDAQFTGNGWVGRCKNCGSPYTTNSYCTCPTCPPCPVPVVAVAPTPAVVATAPAPVPQTAPVPAPVPAMAVPAPVPQVAPVPSPVPVIAVPAPVPQVAPVPSPVPVVPPPVPVPQTAPTPVPVPLVPPPVPVPQTAPTPAPVPVVPPPAPVPQTAPVPSPVPVVAVPAPVPQVAPVPSPVPVVAVVVPAPVPQTVPAPVPITATTTTTTVTCPNCDGSTETSNAHDAHSVLPKIALQVFLTFALAFHA